MKVDDESRLETGTLRDFEPPEPAQKKRSQWWIVVLAVLVAVGLVIFGIMPRIQADKDLKKETARMATAGGDRYAGNKSAIAPGASRSIHGRSQSEPIANHR